MTLNDFDSLVEAVSYCLFQYEETRNSDTKLYEKILELSEKGCTKKPFIEVVNDKSLPKFTTVVRHRRLLQHEYPSLKASKAVLDFRKAMQEQFKEMAREKV